VLLLAHVIGPALGVAMHHLARWNPVSDGVAAAAVLSSAALWWYTRQPWCCPTKAMNVALLYEVFIAACIAFTNNWIPPARLEGLSWICVVLLVFPAILPNQPGRVLGVSLVAASMDPLAYWVAGLRGLAVPSAAEVLWLHAPNYICAVLAVVPARVYLRLGRQVSRARELGSYRLVERIGTGGMGEVWRATRVPAAP
jgi:serine/threonine-protein kinase